MDLKIAKMIAVDLRLSTFEEDRGFKDLLKETVPSYQPPSRMTMSRTLMPKMYDDTRKKV